MKEIVTLQLGHSASFVGTHLWNALDIADQAAVDANVLIRSGHDAERGISTYAPRLVIVDLKGSLGTLKKVNQLYEDAEVHADASWDGKVDVRKQDPTPKNDYLNYLEKEDDDDDDDDKQHNTSTTTQSKPGNTLKPQKQFSRVLDSAVSVWSDFNSMFYHPRTVVELAYSHDDSVAPFAIFNQGSDLWTSDHTLQDDILENRIRFFLEECDNPQGIQVFADVGNAFSGFSASCLESLREDVGKMCITVFGISDDGDGVTEPVKNFNESLAMSQISEVASLYIPLKKPTAGGQYRSSDFGGYGLKSSLQSRYHWTACLAASIDSITLPMRLNASPVTMAGFISPLTQSGPLAMLASSVPFPFDGTNSVKELFSRELKMGDQVGWMHDDTFNLSYDLVERCLGQVSVLRGVHNANSSDIKSSLNDYLSKFTAPIGCNNSYTSETGFPISLAFPDVFTDSQSLAAQAPMFSRLRASCRLAELVRDRVAALHQVPGKVLRMCGEAIAREFIDSAVDSLSALQDAYADDE
ncbi:tubulin domain-containing protein [Obelidium mucronatum]|nr:tubulin domain-containing protein [Obelidium mucronatum]